jgi:hypothetical protein
VTFARYTLLRLLLLFAVLILLWLVGFRGLLLIVLTLVVSVPLSYFVLKGPRTAMTQQLADRMAARGGPVTDPDAEAEDAQAERGSAEREGQRDENAEGELGTPGVAQGGDEVAPEPTTDDGPDGGDQQQR